MTPTVTLASGPPQTAHLVHQDCSSTHQIERVEHVEMDTSSTKRTSVISVMHLVRLVWDLRRTVYCVLRVDTK